MAERIAQSMAAARGLDEVAFTSAATSREELGNAMDRRAQQVLREAGYRADGHRAHQITAAEIADADLVVGMEKLHLSLMRRIAPEADNLALITDFDPTAPPGSGIDDPWYGPTGEFVVTLGQVERAVKGLLAAIEAEEI